MSKEKERERTWENIYDIISLIAIALLFIPIINKINSLSCIDVTNKMWMLIVISIFILTFFRYLVRFKK